MANVVSFALTWALAWGLADYIVVRLGVYDLGMPVQSAGGGALAGALAGASLSVLYWRVFAGSFGRLLFLLAFLVATDVLLELGWEELGLKSFADYVAINAVFGLVLGIILAIRLEVRKPVLGLVRVPLAGLAVAGAAGVARAVQIELFAF